MPSNLRRLAADHAALHTSPLPPNYLFPPNAPPTSDLTSLSLLLAGPTGTPYSSGVFRIHLSITPSYPSTPPTAHFRTRIFHPNIDERSGAVCVDTLKRDWDESLTLRDVLVTIGCLLVCPNAESALNEEAGRLVREDWEAFERRARSMVRVWAGVPREIESEVAEARGRGEENGTAVVGSENERDGDGRSPAIRRKETSTLVMKKKKTPQSQQESQFQSQYQMQAETPEEEESEEYDSSSSTKENDSPIKPIPSSKPPPTSPSPSALKKRPLSVLETDTEPEFVLVNNDDEDDGNGDNDNEPNIAANKNHPTQSQSQKAGGPLRKSPKLVLVPDESLRRLGPGRSSELDMSTLFTSPIRPTVHSNIRPTPVPAPALGLAAWTHTHPPAPTFPPRRMTPTPTPASEEHEQDGILARLTSPLEKEGKNGENQPQSHVPLSVLTTMPNASSSAVKSKPKPRPKPRVGLRRL